MPRQQDLIDFPRGEQEDFKVVLLRWHLDANDYEVTALEADPAEGPIERTVTVLRRSTGKSVHFHAGHVSHWIIDFEHAVRQRAFG